MVGWKVQEWGNQVLAIACLTIPTLMEPRKHFGKKYVRAEEGLDCGVEKFCRAPLLVR